MNNMTDPHPILFVCEHGSAKSVLAATYFNQLAAERGLPVRAIARGIQPDQEPPPRVVEELARSGVSPCITVPVALSTTDLESAARIVSFDQSEAATRAGSSIPRDAWDGLPAVSEDFERAAAAIRERVRALVERLSP